MTFDPHTLDNIRGALKVSDVVGRRFPLRKQGTEFVVADNPSFTVSDSKGFYHDFGNGGAGKPGDIFDFLVEFEGYTFVDAVKELASQASITIPEGSGRASSSPSRSQNASPSAARSDRGNAGGASSAGGNRSHDGVRGNAPAGKKEVVATWDYFDAKGALSYQVCRMQERLQDGSWATNRDGKIKKTFMQRRPSPDGDGAWVMGLDLVDRETGEPHEFMRLRAGWVRYNEENFEKWKLTERKSWPDASNVQHWLYNAESVAEEIQEPRDEQRTIFLTEGEAKVDVLKEWDLLAVTNSGGAGHFTEACAEFFRGAGDVVILSDNDRAGSERLAKLAPMLIAVGANVRALNFKDVWLECPPKGDVKDWRDKGGGTREQLLEIVDGLKPWRPAPYQSKFGAKTAADLGQAVRAYPWRIKGILPMNDNTILMGPSRSGKTFEALDMIMHVMRGMPFAGRKVAPCGFVYLAYEGASGFENRLRAYLKHHEMHIDDLHSFAWLTRPPNMFVGDENPVALADEILKISESFRLPLGGTWIDTNNAATRGSSEIKSEDINRVMTNYDVVKERTGAPLIIIGHTNAEGKHRGNEQFFNNIETAVVVERVYTDAKHTIEKRDDNGRVVRRGRISKQREGDDRTTWEFVLQEVVIGVDEDGEDIKSMVSVEPMQHVPDEVINQNRNDRPEGFYLKGHHVDVFKALLKVVASSKAIVPPAELQVPPGITHVVRWGEVAVEYKRGVPQDDGENAGKYSNRVKGRMNRFREDLEPYNVIGVASMRDPEDVKENPDAEKPKMIHYIWATGRRVYGKGLQWPPLPPKKKQDTAPIIDQATGRQITDMDDTSSPVF